MISLIESLKGSDCVVPSLMHQCDVCSKHFKSSQQLIQHSLVHSNVRKYVCNICNKSFKQLCHLQQHSRIHTGELPYHCSYESCHRSFRQLSSLMQHLKGHCTSNQIKRKVFNNFGLRKFPSKQRSLRSLKVSSAHPFITHYTSDLMPDNQELEIIAINSLSHKFNHNPNESNEIKDLSNDVSDNSRLNSFGEQAENEHKTTLGNQLNNVNNIGKDFFNDREVLNKRKNGAHTTYFGSLLELNAKLKNVCDKYQLLQLPFLNNN